MGLFTPTTDGHHREYVVVGVGQWLIKLTLEVISLTLEVISLNLDFILLNLEVSKFFLDSNFLFLVFIHLLNQAV